MVAFEPALSCRLEKDKIEVLREGKTHSDTLASFHVSCRKSPLGTRLTFHVQKFFPALKDIDVQILADNVQKSLEADHDGASVDL